MQLFKWWILACLLASPAARSLPGNVATTDNVKARLVSETGAIGPGQSIWVALELNIRDGWHTYWRNPGDSGQATTLAWTLPPGFTAGDIVWTTPHRFDLPPLVNYGYAGHAVHLVKITAPRELKSGSVALLQAKAGWLVCSDVCIPEDAQLQLKLPTVASAAALDPKDAALFTAARSDLPNPQPAATGARIQGGNLVLTLGSAWGATLPQITSLAFFPYEEGSIEYGAPQTLSRSKDAVELALKAGDRPQKTGTVRGVLLATEESGGSPAVVPIEIAAAFGAAAGGAPAAETGGSTRPAAEAPGLPSLVLLAVLGGLILNLMPCVFPVLSIKAIGLVEQAKKHPAAVRAKGLVFAAGVVSSMLTLAIVLLALRAGGEEIGWGFQLQSPLFVTLMVYLLLAVGLNLSGVFEIGGGLAGVGDGLTRGDGYRASFFTGVLTTLVATPCTAPFMAAAVGAALTQSPVVALVIFAGLGVGLSLPYLLLSFAPWTRRVLPKPGAWMDTLKQIFAFPMYASAAWLLWVLAQQTSSLGLGAALTGVILIAFSGWAYQKSKSSGRTMRLTALATALAAFVLAVLLPLRFDDAAAASTAKTAAAVQEAGGWQPYDAARAQEITAAGRPLLINFTASWCLTCLVNERNAFSDEAVQAIFRDKGVTLMKGDWTNRDPVITKALAAFGRAGVPLYLVYNAKPGSSEPLVLPQLLTATIVHDAFVDSSERDLK
jgi:thiol:disulfide interchange protein/DsbC/DsbD-like thiol-disulfide interchange protein